MAASQRTTRRTWITNQLFTRTKAPIYAVQWYELPTGDTSEIEVTVGGRKLTRTIANVHLDDDQPSNKLEKWIEELVRAIDETP